jgi:hypothetical protein
MKTKTKVDMQTGVNHLTREEKDLLKEEIRGAWEEFPLEMKKYIYETKKQKLQTLYMIQDWAKNNGHQVIVDLVSRAICCKEDKLEKMKKELGE